MKLFSPWALWFLFFVPIVILMYILKQKFEEKEISSTYLWKQVLKDIEVNTPWQKLKKNILLFLQLLFITLLVLALSDPTLFIKGQYSANLIIVIDNTGSMNTMYNTETRLEKAKDLAEAQVRSANANAEITVISSGRYPKIEIAKTTDKSEAIAKIRGITSSRAAGNIRDSISIVEALSKQYQSYKAIFYSDSSLAVNNINADIFSLANVGDSENVSLDYISHKRGEEGLKVMLRITNRGNTSVTREVSLYGDDKLLDIISIDIEAKTTETIYFSEISEEADSIWAELSEKDVLLDDNVIYDVVKARDIQKVLLISTRNTFIEKALLPMEGIELYKTNPNESIMDEYDLYILDGSIPDTLPEKGSILIINPPEGNKLINTTGDIEGGTAEIKIHPITRYMDNGYFVVSGMKNIEVPYWAATLINAGNSPAVIAGENKGRRTAVIAFDLHSSDFVLTPEFPIFMHNLTEYLVNMGMSSKTSYYCGEAVEINPMPDTKAAYITDPSGSKHEVVLKYPILPFESTWEQGVYKLLQDNGEKKSESLFAVNFPSASESEVSLEAENSFSNSQNIFTSATGRRIQTVLILLILMLAAVEWVVYIRGY